MPKTIAELYNGNLQPIKTLGKFNDEIKHLETLIEKTHADLKNELNDKQKSFFQRYEGNIDEYMCLISEEAFCSGFCVGIKIITEALQNAENIV